MPVNFQQACRRHFDDAEGLEKSERHQNADHLYGLSAECALKTILVGNKNIPNPNSVQRPFREHIDKLWAEYDSALQGIEGGRYVHRLGAKNPFATWRASDRYEGDWIQVQVPIEAAYRRKALRERILTTLQDAISDGIVT
ncbi:hypothetical protein HUW63_32820 [Myxococcus sp. AM001]|nr:hypothetical protein [Myxococcus sp. AM001]